ncbi:MAG: hypothetical protein QM706_12315 [Nitrospira sp.]
MRRLLCSFMILLSVPLSGCGTATVHFTSTSGSPNGTLVTDGFSTAYNGYTTASDTVNIGARSGGGEVVGFSQYRPVALRSVSWLTWFGNQTVDVNLRDQIRVPITFWVLSSPFNTNQTRANNFWFAMQTVYWPERVGVLFTPVTVRDATANVNRTKYLAFTCGSSNANMTALQNEIGFDSGRINVYLVDSVDGSTTRGNACQIGGPFVAIASTAGTDLLSHEMGHDLALTHIDDLTTNFDQTNVMHSASNTRAFLTEGQLFRAHLQSLSAINGTYGVRPGQTTRDCPRDTVSRTCPEIRKRLWPDGSFPAN